MFKRLLLLPLKIAHNNDKKRKNNIHFVVLSITAAMLHATNGDLRSDCDGEDKIIGPNINRRVLTPSSNTFTLTPQPNQLDTGMYNNIDHNNIEEDTPVRGFNFAKATAAYLYSVSNGIAAFVGCYSTPKKHLVKELNYVNQEQAQQSQVEKRAEEEREDTLIGIGIGVGFVAGTTAATMLLGLFPVLVCGSLLAVTGYWWSTTPPPVKQAPQRDTTPKDTPTKKGM